MFGVYIHIPFCKSKCPFCDFSVTSNRTQSSLDLYFEHLSFEIQSQASRWKHHPVIDTLFFGGGTPSLVAPHYIERIIDELSGQIPFAPDIEISMECNPDDVFLDKIAMLQDIGINRFSLGVQSFDDQVLKALGRCHALSDIERAIHIFETCHIQNWSLDLMFALDGQKMSAWQSALDKAVSYHPPHISTYELTIEKGTMFGKMLRHKKRAPFPEAAGAKMFAWTKAYLRGAGYTCYESSNAAKSGFACRHNMGCWQGDAYWGVGVSAHSRWIQNLNIKRYQNPKTFSAYLKTQSFEHPSIKQDITYPSYVEECVWTGLRLAQGIEIDQWKDYADSLGKNFEHKASELFERKLLVQDQKTIRICPEASHLADAIALELLA